MYVQLCIHTFTLVQIHVYARVCVCARSRAATTATPLRPVGAQSNTHTTHTYTHTLYSLFHWLHLPDTSPVLLLFLLFFLLYYLQTADSSAASVDSAAADKVAAFFFIYPLYNKSRICVRVYGVYVWVNLQEPRQNFLNCVTFCNVLHTHTPWHAYSHANNRSCG